MFGQTLKVNAALDDPNIKEAEERRIKKTNGYANVAKKFVNLTDSLGKSPLHFAVFKENL